MWAGSERARGGLGDVRAGGGLGDVCGECEGWGRAG